MQINIYDLFKLTLDEINIEERGQLTTDRFNRWANKAIRDIVDYLTGRMQEFPEPRIEMFKKQKVTDLLYPLIKRRMIPFKNAQVEYPSDYDHFIDIRISGRVDYKAEDCTDMPKFSIDEILNGGGGFRQVDNLAHDKIASRVNTRIPLLKKRLSCEQYGEGFLIHPYQDNGSAFLVYLKEPRAVKLSMVLDGETQTLKENATGHIHPELHNKLLNVLARRIAQYHASWVREEGAVSLSDAVSKTE